MTRDAHLETFIKEYCKKVDITIRQLRSKNRRRDLVEKRMIIATYT
jgi:chromosomal replication initiation ATPase DnaA